jgi:hypothetical protein
VNITLHFNVFADRAAKYHAGNDMGLPLSAVEAHGILNVTDRYKLTMLCLVDDTRWISFV